MRMLLSIIPLLVLLRVGNAKARPKLNNIILFGDSYTDQSRAHSIANGSFPGKDYQEVFPPIDTAADGGVQWPRYLGQYTNTTIWNYAVGGAVCNNALTPLFDIPDVLHGQIDWFVLDHVTENGTSHQKLHLDPSEFIVILFIGTNDVGISSLLTDDQQANTSLADVAACQIQSLRRMHDFGARKFIVNSMIPLQDTGLYGGTSAPVIYWPEEHNGTAWHRRADNFVHTVNALVRAGIADLQREWSGDETASVEYFNTYSLFADMYEHPGDFFNGSLPANSTSWCHKCPVPTDFRFCGIGDCTTDERDSFMWWDELHPSEQSGRILAQQMTKKFDGESVY